jgi:hypothetical protein
MNLQPALIEIFRSFIDNAFAVEEPVLLKIRDAVKKHLSIA